MGNSAYCCAGGCENKSTALLMNSVEDDRPSKRNQNSVRMSRNLSHENVFKATQQSCDQISLQSSTDMSMKTSSPWNQAASYKQQMPTSFMVMNEKSSPTSKKG